MKKKIIKSYIYISFVEDVGYRAASLSTPGALQSDADVSGFKIEYDELPDTVGETVYYKTSSFF